MNAQYRASSVGLFKALCQALGKLQETAAAATSFFCSCSVFFSSSSSVCSVAVVFSVHSVGFTARSRLWRTSSHSCKVRRSPSRGGHTKPIKRDLWPGVCVTCTSSPSSHSCVRLQPDLCWGCWGISHDASIISAPLSYLLLFTSQHKALCCCLIKHLT